MVRTAGVMGAWALMRCTFHSWAAEELQGGARQRERTQAKCRHRAGGGPQTQPHPHPAPCRALSASSQGSLYASPAPVWPGTSQG